MTKYYVEDIKGHKLYEGFDEDMAYKLCKQYNKKSNGTYTVKEIDTDLECFYEDSRDGKNLIFISNEYLTSLYGDDKAIKKNMKMAIEHQTGKKIHGFSLEYDDPGDSGFEATFWAKNIRWKREGKIMYMLVEFSNKNKKIITRTKIVEIPNIKSKTLTNQEITYCENKANNLCNKDEKVLGWKVLESYEINRKGK